MGKRAGHSQFAEKIDSGDGITLPLSLSFKSVRGLHIGLNEKRIVDPELIIEISYRNPKGEKLWPYKYGLNREKIPIYRTWTVKGVKLILVPLGDLIRIE